MPNANDVGVMTSNCRWATCLIQHSLVLGWTVNRNSRLLTSLGLTEIYLRGNLLGVLKELIEHCLKVNRKATPKKQLSDPGLRDCMHNIV
jgi:hypothetical protein